MSPRRKRKRTENEALGPRVALILGCVGTAWAIELVNSASGYALCRWGILPRTVPGLAGIPFWPFLHGGFGHVLVNTGPFVVLGGLVILRGTRVFIRVSLYVLLVGGFLVWTVGRPAYHIGSSGIIFGYFGYLIARGWYVFSIGSLAVATLTILFYGGLLWGLLPVLPHVSWEGHVCGLLAGVMAARTERTR